MVHTVNKLQQASIAPSEPIKVGIVGARARDTEQDKELIRVILKDRIRQGYNLVCVSGGCPKGADKFAEELSQELGLDIIVYRPNLSKLSSGTNKYAYAQACYDRNTLIAQTCDVLIALPGETNGTWDTIAKARKLEKPVIIR